MRRAGGGGRSLPGSGRRGAPTFDGLRLRRDTPPADSGRMSGRAACRGREHSRTGRWSIGPVARACTAVIGSGAFGFAEACCVRCARRHSVASLDGGRLMSIHRAISRRRFLAGALAATAFTIIPRHVLGGEGQPAANQKLNIGAVGVGGMGGHDIQRVSSENIVAICDVDARLAAQAAQGFPDAKVYADFREMIDDASGPRRRHGGDARPQSCGRGTGRDAQR